MTRLLIGSLKQSLKSIALWRTRCSQYKLRITNFKSQEVIESSTFRQNSFVQSFDWARNVSSLSRFFHQLVLAGEHFSNVLITPASSFITLAIFQLSAKTIQRILFACFTCSLIKGHPSIKTMVDFIWRQSDHQPRFIPVITSHLVESLGQLNKRGFFLRDNALVLQSKWLLKTSPLKLPNAFNYIFC